MKPFPSCKAPSQVFQEFPGKEGPGGALHVCETPEMVCIIWCTSALFWGKGIQNFYRILKILKHCINGSPLTTELNANPSTWHWRHTENCPKFPF